MDNDFTPLFTAALEHYETIAQELKLVSDTYPFKQCGDERTLVDQRVRATIESLKRARQAETAGLDVLAELEDPL